MFKTASKRSETCLKLYLIPIILSFILIGVARLGHSEEFSIYEESTVFGRNFGIPTGTPGQEPAKMGNVDLVCETAFFIKNLELTGFQEDTGINGETFIGYRLPLRARYRAHEQVVLELGALLGQDFGDREDLNVTEPLARLVYEAREDLFLVAGSIFPTHWISDALLDDLHRLRGNAEQGFQLRANRESLKNDTWINWRIREETFRAEEFEVGSSSQLRLLDENLWIDGQLLWYHVGGQKNQTGRVENYRAFLAGFSYGWGGLVGLKKPDGFRVGAQYLYSDNDEGLGHGDGFELRVAFNTHPAQNIFLRLHGSHFRGKDFRGIRGDPLYKFDRYTQAGATAIFELPAGLSLETGFVIQHAEHELNYTFHVQFTWGRAITLVAPGPL